MAPSSSFQANNLEVILQFPFPLFPICGSHANTPLRSLITGSITGWCPQLLCSEIYHHHPGCPSRGWLPARDCMRQGHKAGPFLGDIGLLRSGTLGWGLPIGFLESVLELHHIYIFPTHFFPVLHESWIIIQAKVFPNPLQSPPWFSFTGVFPSKSFACLI